MNQAGPGGTVRIPSGETVLAGTLEVPAAPRGIVVFAHGSGSGRLSPRNRFVAAGLREIGMATLLLDLLGEAEDRDYSRRFDIDLLTARLVDAVRFLAGEAATAALPVGAFGASTGAAAALRLAAFEPGRVAAVVSRGGRPDLAGNLALARVRAPTLLVVGGSDPEVLRLNEAAYEELGCVKELTVVPGATHLFEEPGALERVAQLAANWFGRHLGGDGREAA